jgi:hypothetical protein
LKNNVEKGHEEKVCGANKTAIVRRDEKVR